jgi:tetratricopeptide (TPR) repeat protein
MTEERWRRLEHLFETATALPCEQREAFVQKETAADEELRRELLGMLEHAPGAANRIIQSIEGAAQAMVPGASWAGRAFGPYRIIREIAHGGMGVVFEALRDDDEYRKRVALKVATTPSDSGLMQARLRHERQILAGLEHPNIARFLDGGSEGGIPYIAMEYVEGVPITAYCRGLSLPERIGIFRQVCDAVRYAHEGLIVHRDLKPENILVTEDGAPKLLDFGIAKILSPMIDGGETRNMLWTPDYTSPEQVRGRTVTIRTDVYSLGLILYEILCGERAQRAHDSSPLEIERSVCVEDPSRPSQQAEARGDRVLARQLAGDLDTIVSMAIRKEPELRYGSAADLSADLGRYLEGRPVRARQGTWVYRAGKAIRRHHTAAALTILALACLTAGAVSTIHQERRAERRFAQVRKLANTFVFDVHDRIENLPGATAARKFIVETAIDYLETLRQESAGDAALSREIAAAYERIGEVQGSPTRSNLGDTEGALISLGRARDLLEPLVRRNDRQAALLLATVRYRTGELLRARGEIRKAMEQYAEARTICEARMRENPNERGLLILAGMLYGEINRAETELRDAHAVAAAAASEMEVAKRLVALNPPDPGPRAALANARMSLGRALLASGELENSAAEFREAVSEREQLLKEAPQNVEVHRDLMVAYGTLGDILGFRTGENLGDVAGATAAFRRALAIAEWLRAKDPADKKAKSDFLSASVRLGSMLAEDPQQASAGFRYLADSARIAAELSAGDARNTRLRYMEMFVERKTGECLAAMGRTSEAVTRLQHAISMASELIGGSDGPTAREQVTLMTARLAAIEAERNRAHALELAHQAARQIEAVPSLFRTAWTEAQVDRELGQVYVRVGHRREGEAFLEKSLDQLKKLKPPAALEPKRRREMAAVQLELEDARR